MRSKKRNRFVALLTGVVVLLGAQVLFATQPAAAMPGLERTPGARSATDSESPKNVTALCPDGKRVIGGGGRVFAISGADSTKVMLMRLEPHNTANQSGYVAGGVEVAPGITGDWWVEAFAICAPAPAGHEIVQTAVTSSDPVQQTRAECTGDKRVFGTGARLQNIGGQVTLQLTRAEAGRNFSRATGKEDADGFTGNWTLTAFAVCANELPGFSQAGRISETTPADVKAVTHECPAGTFVHNVAAASSGTPPGLATTPPGVALQAAVPASNLRTATVRMVETTPNSVPWDAGPFMICGP